MVGAVKMANAPLYLPLVLQPSPTMGAATEAFGVVPTDGLEVFVVCKDGVGDDVSIGSAAPLLELWLRTRQLSESVFSAEEAALEEDGLLLALWS